MTITDGTNTLTHANGDFEIELSEKVVGTAVFGVVTVKILKPLDFGTTYTVNMPAGNLMSKSGCTAAAPQSIDITTEAIPVNTLTFSDNQASAGLNKFTAKVSSSTAVSSTYLLVGFFDASGELVSYTYTRAVVDDEISIAGKVEPGMTVKAFSCGNSIDLSNAFGSVTFE